MEYDYLIVGAGPFGATCAHELTEMGKKCLVIDKRDTIGGNCYTENDGGIHIHKYGAHIFHTNEKKLWDYINRFSEFNHYSHQVIANYKQKMFTLPFNMWTFNQLWSVTRPEDAKKVIESQKYFGKVSNLEQQALSMVGRDVYEFLIKGYTEKQWNKSCSELPPSIIKRIPVRFDWSVSYFDDKFVGIPVGGYTKIFEKMLSNVEVKTKTDFFDNRDYFETIAKKIIFTGPIDKFFDYEFGRLEYRSLEWVTKRLDQDNFQGNSVVNYTDSETPFTRILEHKWFENTGQRGTIISYEFPREYDGNNEPYYPIRDEKNLRVYNQYLELSKSNDKVIFGGRLANYIYYDMHQIIAQALNLVNTLKLD